MPPHKHTCLHTHTHQENALAALPPPPPPSPDHQTTPETTSQDLVSIPDGVLGTIWRGALCVLLMFYGQSDGRAQTAFRRSAGRTSTHALCFAARVANARCGWPNWSLIEKIPEATWKFYAPPCPARASERGRVWTGGRSESKQPRGVIAHKCMCT
jgi:hypothetical protein